MKLLIMFISWFILLVACWPIALLVLILFPLLWLIALPFRLVAVVVEASFALIRAPFPAGSVAGWTAFLDSLDLIGRFFGNPRKSLLSSFEDYPLCDSFVQASLRVIVRLRMSFPGALSLSSTK